MNETPEPRSTARPSRRTIARGAAWSVPVVAVTAAAPLAAASPTVGATTISACSGNENGTFTVSIPNLPAGASVQISLTGQHGTTSISSSTGTTSGSGSTFTLTSTGAETTTAVIAVARPTLGRGGSSLVTATVSGVGPVVVTGDTTATITFSRDNNNGGGNGVYHCNATP